MMNAVDLRRNTASVQEIASHLREADRSFIPPLSDRIDIDCYAAKLFDVGTRHEAWVGPRLVGLVAGYLNDCELGFISNVSVAPGLERRGVGARLVAAFIADAGAAGIKRLRLEVHSGNIAASQLYRAAGFSREDHGGDLVTMSLELRAAK